MTLGEGKEWRFQPLVVDLNGDSRLDLVATARLGRPSLQTWLGDGKGGFTPVEPTWTDIGYGALAMGDINRDGFPDIIRASHFKRVQILVNDGKGQLTEKILSKQDGYVAAQLADLNDDRHPDLALVGYEKAGVEIYFGDGKGDWRLHNTLPEPRPGKTMPGRAVAIADLNRDGHLDLVAAFQRWGVYIYYGHRGGSFSGGAVDFHSANREFQSIAVGDVNKDGHPDILINGTRSDKGQLNGPDVYLGDGRGGWQASSDGLKVLKFASAGVALGDLDQDGTVDIVAAGNDTGEFRFGYGLFWFRGDGRGGWQLVRESGLPARGLSVPHSVTLADLDGDRLLEIISLHGGAGGSITIWKRQSPSPGTGSIW